MKALFLAIQAWFTNLFASKTDIGLAGQQVIRNTKKAIDDLEQSIVDQRATGLGYERDIILLDKEIEKAKSSYQHYKNINNVDMASKAKRAYETNYQNKLNKQRLLDEVIENINELEKQLIELNNETDSAKNKFESSASLQKVARASNRVEDAHDALNNGSVALAIEQASRSKDVAQARRERRQGEGDIYAWMNAEIPDIDGDSNVTSGAMSNSTSSETSTRTSSSKNSSDYNSDSSSSSGGSCD